MEKQKGFTLVELLLTMSIFGILAGIATLSLSNVRQSASLNTTVNTIITDVKQQQIKAMIGDTEGRTTSDDYGVYFGTTSYTLYHGTYNPSDTSNFEIELPGNIQFSSVTFPDSQILFLKRTGEISGFTSGSDSVAIQDTTNSNQKTIQFNAYGVVTAIN